MYLGGPNVNIHWQCMMHLRAKFQGIWTRYAFVMLTICVIGLRSHEPSTYELIYVKSLLNHLEYLKFYNLHDN